MVAVRKSLLATIGSLARAAASKANEGYRPRSSSINKPRPVARAADVDSLLEMSPLQRTSGSESTFVVLWLLPRIAVVTYPASLAFVYYGIRVSPSQPGQNPGVLAVVWATIVVGSILTSGIFWLRYIQAKRASRNAGLRLKCAWRTPALIDDQPLSELKRR